jgi:hypothetical protein
MTQYIYPIPRQSLFTNMVIKPDLSATLTLGFAAPLLAAALATTTFFAPPSPAATTITACHATLPLCYSPPQCYRAPRDFSTVVVLQCCHRAIVFAALQCSPPHALQSRRRATVLHDATTPHVVHAPSSPSVVMPLDIVTPFGHRRRGPQAAAQHPSCCCQSCRGEGRHRASSRPGHPLVA